MPMLDMQDQKPSAALSGTSATARMILCACLASLALASPGEARAQEVEQIGSTPDLKPHPTRVTGRVRAEPDGALLRQWPGTYFEAAFDGPEAFFRVGPGDVSFRISVDGGAAIPLVKPSPGTYRVAGLTAGPHRMRIDVASESQAEPTTFGGFYSRTGASSSPLPRRVRAIEFIGDSHTVGYGNSSGTRQCTEDEVWTTTDTSRGIAPLTAQRYAADYRVHAISGRGIVRNYNGFPADTLPQAYPYTLFDKAERATDKGWRPQVIVISLGTNDFSTPLKADEKWKTRDELRADYQATFVRFVGRLRAQHPQAYFLLWATDLGDGEIKAQVGRVADRLRRAGDSRVGFVAVPELTFSACNYHPSIEDDEKIARAIIAHLDADPEAWSRSGK